MSEASYESHASEAERQAQRLYGEAMEAENKRFQAALASLNDAHEANVKTITNGYTDALKSAADGIPY